MSALRLPAAALLVAALLALAAGLGGSAAGCSDNNGVVWTCSLSDGGSPFPYTTDTPLTPPPLGPNTCPCLIAAPAGGDASALPAGDCTWLDGGTDAGP